MSKPTYLRFHLEHNEDAEITCLFCMLNACEQCFTVAGAGRASVIGVHNSCADKHMDKLQAPKEEG